MKKLFILTFVFACTSTAHDSEIIKQSIELHEAALKVSQGVVDDIKTMDALTDSLSDDTVVLKDSLVNIKQAFDAWEESIVEVPGHDDHDHHDHHGHDHDHDHDHAPSPDLTDEMVLEIQQEMKDQIEKLSKRTKALLAQFPNE